MSRVIQQLTFAPFWAALLWTVFAAAVEVLVVFFFGGTFSKALMSSMGGMRNSPEEDLVINALGTVFVAAIWTAPVALILGQVVGRYTACRPFPTPSIVRTRGLPLAVATAIWVA